MAKIAVKLGQQAFLWKSADRFSETVVISAHGRFLQPAQEFVNNTAMLQFYCHHGATVDDVPQATNLGRSPVVETVFLHERVVNYTLSKYQEHRSTIAAFATERSLTFQEAEAMLGEPMTPSETYATFRDYEEPDPDFVTIRNRNQIFGGSALKLSDLVSLIFRKHPYTAIKCCFCREAS